MILSDKTIRSLSLSRGLIYPFNSDSLQPCSYDVTLSSDICKFVDKGEVQEIDGLTKDLYGIGYEKSSIDADGYLLMPGEFILGSTNEQVDIPDYIAARFEGKSSLGRIGLSTHVTAGFIDPGFRGNVTLEISNSNRFAIRLRVNQPIGQLCFFRLNTPAEEPYGSADLGSHYQDQVSVTEARY